MSPTKYRRRPLHNADDVNASLMVIRRCDRTRQANPTRLGVPSHCIRIPLMSAQWRVKTLLAAFQRTNFAQFHICFEDRHKVNCVSNMAIVRLAYTIIFMKWLSTHQSRSTTTVFLMFTIQSLRAVTIISQTWKKNTAKITQFLSGCEHNLWQYFLFNIATIVYNTGAHHCIEIIKIMLLPSLIGITEIARITGHCGR